MASENLTPREVAYLRRLWRLHEQGTLNQRYIIIMSVLGGLTLMLCAVPIFGFPDDWPQSSVWTSGLFTGYFVALAVVVTLSKKRWELVARFVDWNRIEAVTAGSEE
jgi:hypothetical protein